MKKLAITSQMNDKFILYLDEEKQPTAFKRKMKDLMENAGCTESDARAIINRGILMEPEVTENGIFLVESELLPEMTVYDPYTGLKIINEYQDDNLMYDMLRLMELAADFETLSKEEFLKKWAKGEEKQNEEGYDNTKVMWEYDNEFERYWED